MCPGADVPAAGADPADGASRGGPGLDGFPRHRRVDSERPAPGPGGVEDRGYSPDRLLRDLLIGVGVFEDILAGLDPETQAAAVAPATEARDRLRAAFDAVSYNHTQFDQWSAPAGGDTGR